MTEFLVTWSMDFVADSAEEAARMALDTLADMVSGNVDAKVFEVTAHGSEVTVTVDLCDEPHDLDGEDEA